MSTPVEACWKMARVTWRCRTCSTSWASTPASSRSEEHTSELQSRLHLVCRLLLEKKTKTASHLGSHHQAAPDRWLITTLQTRPYGYDRVGALPRHALASALILEELLRASCSALGA